MIRYLVRRPHELGPWREALRRLEASILYPVADGEDAFSIDHGPDYHPFFSTIGEAWFLLAVRGDELVGSVTGVARPVRAGGREVEALYICDLKVASTARGTGLARRLILRGLFELLRIPRLRRVRLLYGAAMQGARGDVMRTARGWNPLRLGRPTARLALYFVPPAQLAALDPGNAPPPPDGEPLMLGPSPLRPLLGAGWCRTDGMKDLRLQSSGAAWPLVHLAAGPDAWKQDWAGYLRACGRELEAVAPESVACFTVDERLRERIDWLAARGLSPGAGCTLYALDLSLGRPASWVHLPSSEI